MRGGHDDGSFVLDNSIVMPWVFEDEEDPPTRYGCSGPRASIGP